VFLQWLGLGDDVDRVVSAVDDGEALRETITEALATAPAPPATYTGAVDATRQVAVDRAEVEFRIVGGRLPVLATTGVAVRADGRWLVSRGTYCDTIAAGPVRCPPR